jgi:hypothetical protein
LIGLNENPEVGGVRYVIHTVCREIILFTTRKPRLLSDEGSQQEKLIEVWKLLEALAVSMDRMGHYWRIHGEEVAKEAIHDYMGPAMSVRIAHARSLLLDILGTDNPDIGNRLERIAEDEDEIGYWQGPNAA